MAMDIALSLLSLTVVALLAGAFYLWRRGVSGPRVLLMVVLAAVLAANVAIWVIPTRNGATLAGQVEADAGP